ncbi:MAG: NADH-quinone oxidoreductase subunit NuoE [Thermoguttaceae bacterium]|jgi:NADH:ubiquinone oxidoreductase subunit E|nr:NADH-quinone oxidoreductase subunit NuoE [Thermoguttaceae bacterium]
MSTTTDNWQEVQSAARETLGEEIAALIDACREDPHPESRLIGVLHKVQETFGYLGEEQLDAVAQLLQVPAAKVSGVASFYHFFRLTPRGKYVIHICMGTACYVKGADRVAQKFMEELGISWGETSNDRIFTLEGSRCLGTCGLAPVVMIGDDVHGNVTADQVPVILDTYLKRARETQ